MSDPVRVAIVGMGGFAGFHRRAVARLVETGRAIHVAQVAPPPDHAPFRDELQAYRSDGVRIHDCLRELLAAERGQIDLLCIPTGIPLHRTMVVASCEAGMDCLVEKPAAGSIQDVDAMIAARDRHGVSCTVGYQHLYNPTTHQLKRWLVEGRFGKVSTVSGYGCWPRGDDYYSRNGWAGELCVGDTWVLDGPHNNALAHSVNVMGFLAGTTVEAAAIPRSITSELYRVNPIRAADTVCLRVETDGPTIFFAVSHATEKNTDPGFRIDAEKATLDINFVGGITIKWRDGRRETVDPVAAEEERAVGGAVEWMAAGAPTAPEALATTPHCSLEVARTQTLIACGSYEAPIHEVSDDLRAKGPKGEIAVKGMLDTISRAFDEGALFSELGVPWAQAPTTTDLTDYCYYPTAR